MNATCDPGLGSGTEKDLRNITELIRDIFLKILFIYLFIYFQREGNGGKEGNINVWLPLARPLLGDLACTSGMCPDWESNWQPLGSQASAQSTEPHQPGPVSGVLIQACVQ